MGHTSIKNKYFDFKISDTQDMLDKFRGYISRYDCPEVLIDLSSLNFIDTAKVMVLSSTYHFQKYPHGKVKCKVAAKEVIDFVGSFVPDNLELV